MNPRTTRSTAWRFALAAILIVAFTAATTATAGLLQVQSLVGFISQHKAIATNQITPEQAGNPQTLLLIGSDHRAGEPFSASNTDTMLLVHLDPNSSTINVLSVPRDLKVTVPFHHGSITTRLNAAYSIGGPNLLLRVIRGQVLPGLRINHVIDVNFRGFAGLVDAIGCVYANVDHRYYNDTRYTGYSSIDIQPGYEMLCGDNQSPSSALAFVRFRHTDSDIVRNARQQDFLRWAKDGFSQGSLVSNRGRLTRVFGANAQTDAGLQSVDGLLNLFDLVAFSAGHTVKSIPFPAILQTCTGGVRAQTPCYVTALPSAEAAALRAFLRPTVAKAAVTGPAGGSNPAGGKPRPRGRKVNPALVVPAGTVADPADGQSQAAALGARRIPVFYPVRIATTSRYCTNVTCPVGPDARSYPRAYFIHGRQNQRWPSYYMTLVVNPALGQYYGIQGTTWRNPPILNKPTLQRDVGGKHLLIYANGGKVNLVAFKTPRGVYWISNTLTDSLTNNQMVTIAASMVPAR